MIILSTAMHKIDSINNAIETVKLENTDISDYVGELLKEIFVNKNYKHYKARSNTSEVTSSIFKCVKEVTLLQECTEAIAKKYLKSEFDTRTRYSHLKYQIREGHLIQVMLYDRDKLYYFISKVELDPFLSGESYKKLLGYPYKRGALKTCLYEFEDKTQDIDNIYVVDKSDTEYWKDLFLDLIPCSTNEAATKDLFNLIDKKIATNTKNSLNDYYNLRNQLVSYFNQPREFTYDNMIDAIFNNYIPSLPEKVSIKNIIRDVDNGIKNKEYDTAFTIVPQVLKNKFKRIIKANDFINIQIIGESDNFKNAIHSYKENGKMYVAIETDDEQVYRSFLRK